MFWNLATQYVSMHHQHASESLLEMQNVRLYPSAIESESEF